MKSKFPLILIAATIILTLSLCKKDEESKDIIVTLGAQANTTIDGFYAVSENKTYTISEAFQNQSVIDIFCFYEAETGNNIALASPGTGIKGIFSGSDSPENWTTKDTTYFYQTTLTAAQFDAVQENDELIISSFNAVDARKKAKDVKVDQVWSFKTSDIYFGLLKITEVVPGTNGSVKFVVKTMKKVL